MRAAPAGVDLAVVREVVARAWHIDVSTLEQALIGGGGHHWIAAGAGGARHFVTVDDLDDKPWLGSSTDEAFEGLCRAFETSIRLRDAGCLEFVRAPLPDRDGQPVRRLDDRHTVSVTPFVEGRPGSFHDEISLERRSVMVSLLSRLHGATPHVRSIALSRAFAIPGRQSLDAARASSRTPWTSGPLAEEARQCLVTNSDALDEQLRGHAHLAAEVAATADPVITHGEPHPGNLISTEDGLVLIDWDTVALAPCERDLWLLGDWPAVSESYRQATGRQVNPAGLRLYALAWRLTDIASFAARLRAPHERTADTEHALTSLTELLG